MNKPNKVRFITANDEQGKIILEYFNKTCQQALKFCQKNNLQSYEDFAQTIKIISDKNAESKGDHLAIRVGVKGNDLVLSLANRPHLGATKSIKMLEHLGQSEKYQYTRTSVEELLQKEEVKENNEFNTQELSDFSSSFNDEVNPTSRDKKNSHLDYLDLIEERTSSKTEIPEDLLFQTEEIKSNTNHQKDAIDELLDDSVNEDKVNNNNNLSTNKEKQSKTIQQNIVPKNNKNSKSRSSYPNRASKTLINLAEKADSYTSDTDGMTVTAASLRMGAVGIALANKLLENPEEEKLEKTINRILAVQERTNQLIDRSKSLEQKVDREESKINSELDLEDELEVNDDRAPSGQGLGDRVWGVGKSPQETDRSLSVYGEEKINVEKEKAVRSFLNNSLPQAPSLPGRSPLHPNPYPPHPALRALDLDIDTEIEPDNELDKRDDLDLEKDISKQLNKAVNTIDNQLQDLDPDISAEPIVIDRNADFNRQLAQINAALDQLEQKLDSLEKRIKHLEQSLNSPEEPIKDHLELNSENNIEINQDNLWKEDTRNQENEEIELDSQLVHILVETDMKCKQINPDDHSGIPIGDSCKLCNKYLDNKTIVTIEEKNGEEIVEIFQATIEHENGERNNGTFNIDKDELSREEKQSIVKNFSQELEKINEFLDQQQKQNQPNHSQPKKQKEITLT